MTRRNLTGLKEYLASASGRAERFVISIDGPGASGKSVFGDRLNGLLPDSQIIRFDDFYVPVSDPSIIGSNFDWLRLVKEVLEPLKNGTAAKYRALNWKSMALDKWVPVENRKFTIIDGVTSGRRELRKYVDFLVFVDAPEKERLSRGLGRDGIGVMGKWIRDWIPRENAYFDSALHRTRESADLVVNGLYEESRDADAFETLHEKDAYFGNQSHQADDDGREQPRLD
jgi:uridine kinase